MKEYIEKAAVKDEILSWAVCINHPELLSKEDTMHCIDNMPSANVAEVVRCRECTHYKICDEWESGKRMLCEIHHHSYLDHDGDNHFCSWGQRKTETVLAKSDAKDESLEADHAKV